MSTRKTKGILRKLTRADRKKKAARNVRRGRDSKALAEENAPKEVPGA